MTEQHGLSYPTTSVDWIQGINLDGLRDGRLARAKKQLFEVSKFGAFLSLNEWNTRYISSTYTPQWTTPRSGLRYLSPVPGRLPAGLRLALQRHRHNQGGVSTKEIDEKWPSGPEVWADIGVMHEDQTAGNNWAHGIGLTLYEPPMVWRGCSLEHSQVIEEDMCFAIETQEGDHEGQGVRIEEVIHVTRTGVEILSKWPAKEITVTPDLRTGRNRPERSTRNCKGAIVAGSFEHTRWRCKGSFRVKRRANSATSGGVSP